MHPDSVEVTTSSTAQLVEQKGTNKLIYKTSNRHIRLTQSV